MKMHRLHNLLLSLLVSALVLPSLALAEDTGGLVVTPEHILMGAQYNGLKLKVQGTVPAGSDLILRFTGAPEQLHLREKGKVLGLLWMNIGKISLKNVPKVCLIDSSRPFAELGKIAEPFRLSGLRDAIEIEEGGSGKIDIAHELLLLKQHQGLYNEASEGISFGSDTGTGRSFAADLPIPSALAPGDYHIEAIAIKDGQIAGRYSTAIKAELTGFPRWLSKLAFERSLLYGILATLIAIFSGLAIGLVFQSKGAH